MSIRKISLVTALAVLTLAACGKKDEPIVVPDYNKNLLSPPSAASQPPASLPQADANRALDSYQKVDSGAQIAYLYYALSGMPVDYQQLAQAVSADYRATSDTFKQKAIVDALKPQIDAQIAAFKKSPYIVVHWQDAQLSHYDMSGQFFPLNGIPLDGTRAGYFSDAPMYQYVITNGTHFEQFKVEDQNKAKDIEAVVSSGYPDTGLRNAFQVPTDGYLFAQGVDTSMRAVKLQLVELSLNDPKGIPVGVIR